MNGQGMAEITNFTGGRAHIEPISPSDDAASLLMQRVGWRVRKARELKAIPRRVLSEISGVSPRYLAQLEAGDGNISISLLHRVATALDHRIDWLVGEEDPRTSETLKIGELYRLASADIRAQVMHLLHPQADGALRGARISLIGLRGAGKSTLGALAAKALGVPFLELNREIEEHAGISVNEVMALYGQEGYRKLEAEALNRTIAAHETLILAVAGGIVAEPDTYKTLLARFHTIWVRAAPHEHMARVLAQGDTRPMAGNPAAMEQLTSILMSREAHYKSAEAQLDTSGQTLEHSLGELLQLIRARFYLDP